MARSFEHYFRLLPKTQRMIPAARLWSPAADVYRAPDGWLVMVELAGVRPDELEIEIGGSTLAVRGTRRDAVCRKGMICQQIEITYSRFEKTIRFPCPIEDATVERDYRDGLLILYLRSPATCDE